MLVSVVLLFVVHPDHGRHMIFTAPMIKIMIPMQLLISDRSVTFLSKRQTGLREHLLSTGLKVLHARGDHACGVQDIVAGPKVLKGSLCTNFESRSV